MFGKTVTDFQNTQFVLAEIHAQVLARRFFIDRCIELHVDGASDAVDAARAKMITTELTGVVTDKCLQLFGGWG